MNYLIIIYLFSIVNNFKVMLTSALRALINNPFQESFDTIFMGNEKKNVKILIRTCLVDYNRQYNVIVILIVQLFFSLIMFLLQRIVIPYEQLFFKMMNNYSSLKCCFSYSFVSAIISKLNIFLNKQTFHIYLTIIKL